MDNWVMWASEPDSLSSLALRSTHFGMITGRIPQEDIERASIQVKRMLNQAYTSGYEPTVRVPRQGLSFEGAYKENVRLLPCDPSFRAVAENTCGVARPASYEYVFTDYYQGSTRLNIVARYPWREYSIQEKKEYLSQLIDNIKRKNVYTLINYIDSSRALDRSQFAKEAHLHDNLSVTKEISAREKPLAFHAFEEPEDVVNLREYTGSFTKPGAVGDSQVLAGMRRTVTTFEEGISGLRDTLTGAEFLPEILL